MYIFDTRAENESSLEELHAMLAPDSGNVQPCDYFMGRPGTWGWDSTRGVVNPTTDTYMWAGAEGYGHKDTVGLRLDVDLGQLEAYKNGRRLGVLATGLRGTFCWYVWIYCEDLLDDSLHTGRPQIATVTRMC